MPQQPQQPVTPVVVIETDDALKLMWGPHDAAVAEAQAAGQNAEPFERDASARRAEARAKREQAEKLIAEAAELEAAANHDDSAAQFHRQEQGHKLRVAGEIAAAVDFLRSINNRLHPEELRQRAEQQAAANAQVPDPLNDPIGDLVSASADPSRTGPRGTAEVPR